MRSKSLSRDAEMEEFLSESDLVAVVFPSHQAAKLARKRLVRAGFARNSIDIERQDDEFEVSISTRAENRARAERILNRPIAQEYAREAGVQAVDTFNDNRLLFLGGAALAGFALFGLFNRR